MIPLEVTVTTWLVWIIIGIVAGYMTGRLIGGGSKTFLNVVIGVVGAVLGGYIFISMCGDTENNQIISLMSSLAMSGLFLWVATALLVKKHDEE